MMIKYERESASVHDEMMEIIKGELCCHCWKRIGCDFSECRVKKLIDKDSELKESIRILMMEKQKLTKGD